jgi:chromosome segregation ATPase
VVVVYAKSTNWENAFKKEKEKEEAARAAADTSLKEVKEARDAANTFEAQVEKRLKEEDKIRKNLETQVADAKDEADKSKKALADSQRQVAQALDDVSRMQKEKGTLELALKDRDTQNAKLLAEYNTLNQEATSYRLENQALRDRDIMLAKQLKAAEDLIKKQGISTTTRPPTTPAPIDPPTDVDGLVTAVDDQHSLLEISIGGDSGIEKDQTLDAWRIEANNNVKYLGTIRIMEVRAKKAVARPSNDRVQLKVGDHVGKVGG